MTKLNDASLRVVLEPASYLNKGGYRTGTLVNAAVPLHLHAGEGRWHLARQHAQRVVKENTCEGKNERR